MKNVFEKFISLTEACKLFSKGESTLKTNIKNRKFVEGIDCKKFGKTWVFDIDALEREYGSLSPENKNKIRLDNLYYYYKEWRKISGEMLADGMEGSIDCAEDIVREDFSNFAKLEEEITYEDMAELQYRYSIEEE